MERDLPGHSPGDPERRLYAGGGADREPTRAELLESNVHLGLLLSSVAQAVWEAGPDGTITADSPSWRAYTGQSLDDWREDGWTQAIHPDDRDMALRHWHEAVRTRSPVDAEFRIWNAGRGWRWTNARAAPVFDADGTLSGGSASTSTSTSASVRKRNWLEPQPRSVPAAVLRRDPLL